MLAVQNEPAAVEFPRCDPLPLENGDRLHSTEFLRRFEAMPEVKKAELIEGKVYMGSPVRADFHGRPDNLIQTWLGTYTAHASAALCYTNPTLILDADNTCQPDAVLCLPPERGGRARLNAKGYLCGPPELIVEIAASSASIDLGDKLRVYQRSGVPEYLVWRTAEKGFDWFQLEGEDYQPQRPDAAGLLRSRSFAGLVLATEALLRLDGAAVLAPLQVGVPARS